MGWESLTSLNDVKIHKIHFKWTVSIKRIIKEQFRPQGRLQKESPEEPKGVKTSLQRSRPPVGAGSQFLVLCMLPTWGRELNLPRRLVAAMMKTCRRVSRPSISVSSWLTTRALAPDWENTTSPREQLILKSSFRNGKENSLAITGIKRPVCRF